MCLHVDDFFVVSSKEKHIKNLHQQLVREYGEVTHKEGDLLAYLGCKISINPKDKSILLAQPAYIEKILERFLSAEDWASKRRVLTPMKFDDLMNIVGDDERPCRPSRIFGDRRVFELFGSI